MIVNYDHKTYMARTKDNFIRKHNVFLQIKKKIGTANSKTPSKSLKRKASLYPKEEKSEMNDPDADGDGATSLAQKAFDQKTESCLTLSASPSLECLYDGSKPFHQKTFG